MTDTGDMIVGLTNLPSYKIDKSIKIKRTFIGDKDKILEFVSKNFQKNWYYQVELALMQEVSKCFIATCDGEILGFACYDTTAKGFFGPMGVLKSARHRNIGRALLVRALESMRECGYAYAIIGRVDNADTFFKKAVGAEYIKNSNPENSVYSNMIYM